MRTLILLILLSLVVQLLTGQDNQKNRVIVLTDIEADPDDTQSLVRLLLYSNEIDIEGIIATTSCWMRIVVHPQSIVNVIQAYEKVQPNLIKHHTGLPETKSLNPFNKNKLAIIWDVTDKAKPYLTRHKKIIVNIQPKLKLHPLEKQSINVRNTVPEFIFQLLGELASFAKKL